MHFSVSIFSKIVEYIFYYLCGLLPFHWFDCFRNRKNVFCNVYATLTYMYGNNTIYGSQSNLHFWVLTALVHTIIVFPTDTGNSHNIVLNERNITDLVSFLLQIPDLLKLFDVQGEKCSRRGLIDGNQTRASLRSKFSFDEWAPWVREMKHYIQWIYLQWAYTSLTINLNLGCLYFYWSDLLQMKISFKFYIS